MYTTRKTSYFMRRGYSLVSTTISLQFPIRHGTAAAAAAAAETATFFAIFEQGFSQSHAVYTFQNKAFHRKEHIAHSKYTFHYSSQRHSRAVAGSNRRCNLFAFFKED